MKKWIGWLSFSVCGCFANATGISVQLGETTQTGSYERSGFVNYGDSQRTTFGDQGSYQNQTSSNQVTLGEQPQAQYRTRYPNKPHRPYPPIRRYGYGYPAGGVGYVPPTPVVGYTSGSGTGVISQSQVYVDTRPIYRKRATPFDRERLIDSGTYYAPRDLRKYPNQKQRFGQPDYRVPSSSRGNTPNCTNTSNPIYGREFGDSGRDASGGYNTLPRC